MPDIHARCPRCHAPFEDCTCGGATHQRRASASRRRRHRTQLVWRIRQIAPGAATVLLTPIWTDATEPTHRTYIATARTADGTAIRLPRGGSRQLAALVQGVWPAADWNRAQTWHADSNQITSWGERASRDFRDSAAAGHVEDLDQFGARTHKESRNAA